MLRKSRTWIALLLSVVLIVGCFPTGVFAVEAAVDTEIDSLDVSSGNAYDEIVATNNSNQDETTVKEIVSLRSENVKHFDMGDGTYQAVTYGYPVHRKDETGKWQDIDNTLTLQRISTTATYKTNDSRVKFASEYASSASLLTLSENGYTIEMSFVSPSKGRVSAAKVNHSVSRQGVLSESQSFKDNDELTVVNDTSSIKYENVVSGVDLEYILHSNDVKENIIVNRICDNYTYTFGLKTNNLIAELNESGAVYLRDAVKGNIVYVIPTPYMYDSNGEISYEVAYQLNEIKNGTYELTITADEKWINAAGRDFPVVIDPTISSTASFTYDTYVNSIDATAKGTNYGFDPTLWISNPYRITFIKSDDMPWLPTGATITNASLKIAYYYYSGITGGMYITAHQMMKYWDETSTWNTLSNNGQNTVLGISPMAQSTTYLGAATSYPQWASIDITNAAKWWYYDGAPGNHENYGVALKYKSGNSSVILHSYDAMNGYTPYFTVTYKIPNGVYAIGKANTNVYIKNNTLKNLSWVYQETFTSPPTDEDDRDYMFKIAYRAATDDYVIRSMSNNEIILYFSESNNAPVAGKVTVSGNPATDSNISTGYTWKITTTSDGYEYIWYQNETATYYLRSASNEGGGPILSCTTNKNNTGTKWSFHEYTGDPIDGIGRHNIVYDLIIGESCIEEAYMYSSTIGRNGPVTYSSADTNIFTVNQSTGLVTAAGPGSANIWVTYSGAPWLWGRISNVEDTYFFRSGNGYITPTNNATGASLKANSFNGNAEQNWEFIYQGDGYYLIQNRATGYYMTSPNNITAGAIITQQELLGSNTDRQLWKIKNRYSEGAYRIQSKARELDESNLFLGYSGESIIQKKATGYVNWRLSYVNSSTTALEGQQMSKWCWVTSARMLTNHYFGVPNSRTQITAVTAVKGKIEDAGGTNAEAIEAVGHYRSNSVNSNVLNLVQDSYSIFEEEILIRFINDGHVVYICRGWYDEDSIRNGGHAYLVYGYTKEIVNGIVELRYLIRDPYPTSKPDPWETPTSTIGITHLWSYDRICNGGIEDTGIWDGYVVVNTEYATNTILPFYN